MSNVNRTIEAHNYGIDEGDCRCGCGMKLQEETVLAHQAFNLVISRVYGAPVRHIMTSGARCESHNASVGGEKDSTHIGGWATDGYWEYKHRNQWIRIDPQEVAMMAIKSGLFGGIGFRKYQKAGTNIIHLDMRAGPAVTW